MLSIPRPKVKAISLLNSGLALSYNLQNEVMSLNVGNYDIGIPLEIKTLEIVRLLDHTMDDARSGSMQQSVWENPTVQDLNKRLGSSKKIALSYYIMMTFLGLARTRDIWLAFRDIHHSLLSYLRNRAIATELLMKYKVALLSCHLAGYGLHDLAKIEKTFENCGLDRSNYIFYLLLLLDGYNDNIRFDTQDVCVLSVEEMDLETSAFIDNKSTMKLCLYHTYLSLDFIVKSHRITHQDLATELATATQVAYTTIRPFKTKAFSENYARRAMTNTVMRIQQAHSLYDSKRRLVKTEDGYANTNNLLTEGLAYGDIDPTFDHTIKSSLNFSEDQMIEHLDRYRAVA